MEVLSLTHNTLPSEEEKKVGGEGRKKESTLDELDFSMLGSESLTGFENTNYIWMSTQF